MGRRMTPQGYARLLNAVWNPVRGRWLLKWATRWRHDFEAPTGKIRVGIDESDHDFHTALRKSPRFARGGRIPGPSPEIKVLQPGRIIRTPEEAEAVGLTVEARRMREGKLP